jgi:riboflavin synthase
LERALRLGDRLGGHIVSGHVDQAAVLASRTPKGESLELFFSHPPELGRHIVSKGSVALDGVSLTVNEKRSGSFSVNVIPETLKRTTLSSLKTSDRVNLETDILGKHVESLLLFHLGSAESGDGGRKTGGLTLEKLVLEGF